MASVFPVKKGSSKYCVMYWYETDTGERKQKKVSGFNSKEEAWAAARDLERKSAAGIDVNGGSMTCGELMERWFADRVNALAATTRAKYSDGMDRLATTFIADLPIRKLNPQRFNLLMDQLTEKVSVRTALDYSEPLRHALSWAVAKGMIPINPLNGVTLPKSKKRDQRILTDKDVEDLLAAATSPLRRCREYRIPLLLVLYGGLRREECAGLMWQNVDFKRRRITIQEVVTMTPDGREHIKDPKTFLSARTISMPAFVMNELEKEYQKFLARPNAHTLKHNPRRRVCVTSTGDPYSLKSYCHPLRRLIREINAQREKENRPRMPEASFHDLRHTHSAMLIRRDVQPKVISERLGHASIKITMDLYGYLMPGLQDAVADLFDQEKQDADPSSAVG